METLDSIIDTETLKSSYLFPAIPYDESVCKQVLSYQLVTDSSEADAILFNIREVISKLEYALCVADRRMAKEKNGEVHKLHPGLFFLLLGPCWPLHRIDGREVNDIKGKYIMACCLSVPDCCTSPAWELAKKSVELYDQRKDDFELIILLRKRRDGWEEFASFEDFLKPFHPSCIIIRLSDDCSDHLKNNEVLVIDPKERVLFHHHLLYTSDVGSAAFPFTDTNVARLRQECWLLKHSSLEILLGVEPSHKVFRKLPGTDPLQEECRCISEFQSKIVFLYTYHIGNHLALLYNTVIGLREKGMEFEIITAYVPACDYHNPEQFLEVFSSLVAQRGLSWWVVPYDSSTYPRLRPLYATNTISDQLIVFDPKLNDGDPHGLEVMYLYGQSMFPFTKMFIAEHVMKELSQVTLESLFEPITHLCKEDPEYDNDVGNKKSVLMGKNVLVYFDSFVTVCTTALDQFGFWYNSLGEKRRNFEVVCVYLDTPQQHEYNIALRRQFPKWLISSDDEKAYSKYVVDNFFLKLFKHKFSTFVAFGKDGKICSLCAHRLLSSSKAVTFPFNGDLQAEILNILKDYFTKRLAR